MPDRERVQRFIDMVVAGDHVRAIADFYHADASMQENLRAPRQGRALLIAHERQALTRTVCVVTHPPDCVMVDGDRVLIHWVFDFTDHEGITRRLDELALQRWAGDRIAEERFAYDSASAWEVVRGPD